MLLAYVDESFTRDWFAMAALLVDGPAAIALTDHLDRVALKAAVAHDLSHDVELHGHEIFHGGGGWKGVPPRARVGVFDDVIEAVAASEIAIVARAIDLVGQRERYVDSDPAYSIVLQHLLERVDELVARSDEFALVIADEVDEQPKHRSDLSRYQTAGTAGYRQRRLTRIVDTLHFAPSHASRLVQAADIVAFLYRRVFTHVERDDRSRRAKIAMWNRLQPRVVHAQCWFPTPDNGQPENWGNDLAVRTKGPLKADLLAGRYPVGIPHQHPNTDARSRADD